MAFLAVYIHTMVEYVAGRHGELALEREGGEIAHMLTSATAELINHKSGSL